MAFAPRFPWSRVKRYAVIDIGTNTCLLLIGATRASSREYEIVHDEADITQLGKGFYATERLREDAVERTLQTVARFFDVCDREDVDELVITGTSVLRDAQNGEEFVNLVRERHGVELEIIPGEEEARLSYLAVRRDDSLPITPDATCIVTDIGGGSAEMIIGDDRIRRMASLDVGSVRLTEMFIRSDPPKPNDMDALRDHLAETFAASAPPSTTGILVGVGGTITTLASVAAKTSPSAIHGFQLNRQTVAAEIERFASMRTAQRAEIDGLDPKRASVILAGALITERVMDYFRSEDMWVSVRGLRYGIFVDRFLDEGDWRQVKED